MNIQLSDHFTYKKLLRFTLSSIVMMIFSSIYGVADGFFVSNFVGKTQFAAVNFILPFLMILGAAGFMFGTGGSALVAKTMGEGKEKKANETFSLIIYVSVAFGVFIAAIGIVFIRPAAILLGADAEMLEYCVAYGRIYLLAMPALILQYEFQSFLIAAEKPGLGLAVTVGAGVTNMVLDALFTAVFNFGIKGAAAATAISLAVGGLSPLVYFLLPNSGRLHLTGTHFDSQALLRTCLNGSSELMSNISMSLVGMLYNMQLMKYAGEDGVAAYGVLMYVSMIFMAVFIGFSVGTAPVISFNYGAQNQKELREILKKSLIIIGIVSALMFVLAEIFAEPLSGVFVGYDDGLCEITLRGFYIFSFVYLFSGIAIYGSSFFTALNNGLISALISFLRTLLFQTAAVFILPIFWELDGIWFSVVAADFVAAAVTVTFIVMFRKKYQY